jgi:hypothetical protein
VYSLCQLGWNNVDIHALSIGNGWLGILNHIESLMKIESVQSLSVAISLLYKLLGKWDEPSSLLGQLKQNSNREGYTIQGLSKPSAIVGNLSGYDILNDYMPRYWLEKSITYLCMCLTELVEEKAYFEDINALSDLVFEWSNIESNRDCIALSTISRAFIILGYPRQAFNFLVKAIDYQMTEAGFSFMLEDLKYPSIGHIFRTYTDVFARIELPDFLCIAIYEFYVASYDFDSAVIWANSRVGYYRINNNSNRKDAWVLLLLLMHFQIRNPEMIMTLLEHRLFNLVPGIGDALELIAEYTTHGTLNYEKYKKIRDVYFGSPFVSIPLLRFIIECAWYYGDQNWCSRRAKALLRGNKLDLPLNRHHKIFFEKIAQGELDNNWSIMEQLACDINWSENFSIDKVYERVGLVYGTAFFAAKCWIGSGGAQGSRLKEQISPLLNVSESSLESFLNWNDLLNIRSLCSICGEGYRLENLSICCSCGKHFCYRCSSAKMHSNGNKLCKCGGEEVG